MTTHPIVFVILPVPQPRNLSLGQSGGATRFEEIFRRLGPRLNLHIVATPYTISYYQRKGLLFTPHPIITNLSFSNFFNLCLYSTILVFRFLINHRHYLPLHQNFTIYSTSDLFWEVIPAFFLRQRFPVKSTWIQPIYHLYPPWYTRPGNIVNNFFGYFSQKLSHFLIKKRANTIILINSQTKTILQSHGFTPDRLIVSGLGVNLNQINSATPSNKKYSAVFLGRLNSSKGIFDLVKIWKTVNSHTPSAKLAIIGEGPLNIKQRLIKEINDNHLSKSVLLLGFLPSVRVYSIMKSSRIFLFPSHEEGWGIAIAEAMACKLPVIAWNLSVYHEIYGQHVISVPEHDIKKFSNQVQYLLDQDIEAKQIGINNFQFIRRKYSWDVIANHEYKIIQS